MMDEHARKLCEELETLRQAGTKVQGAQALSNNVARQAEVIEQLKLLGIDPSTLAQEHPKAPGPYEDESGDSSTL